MEDIMKRLLLLVSIFVVLFGCSTVPKPRMVHSQSGAKYKSYRKLIEEKRNVLLSFEGYPGYEALVWSADIRIFDYNLLGFIPIYRSLNVFIENNGFVLLEDLSQGTKVLYITLIPKTENLPRTTNRYSIKRKIDKRRGKIILKIGIGENAIQITDPKFVEVQQIIHVEKAVSQKKKKVEEKVKKGENNYEKRRSEMTDAEYDFYIRNKKK